MIQLNGNITLVVGETYQLTVNNLELTMPYSDIKHSIDISLGVGVTTYKLKFPDLGNGTKVQGLLNGVSIKAGKDVTLTSSTSLKSYKRGTVTYWSIEVIANPVVVVEDNNVPQIGLLAIDPNNINTTDDIPEGVVNLYYLDSRARESISATAPIDYDNVTGVISTELTQYTNADVGLLFTNGVHTGISFTAQANRINATVSLSGFSLDALSDVVLGGLGLQTGQVLKYSANKWINTKLLSTELSDSDLLMRRADNLNNLGNVATARNNLGLGSAALLDSNVVITTSSNIGDLGNVMLANLANGHTLKYSSATDKWFNAKLSAGDVDGLSGVYAPINSPTFTGLPLAPAPANNSNSTQIATTAWVKARIAEGGGGGGGGATSLDQLTDVSIDDLTQAIGQTLRFDGTEYVNAKLASTDLSDTASILLKSGNLAGLTNTATARTNLGLGSVATLDTGTGLNQVLKFTVANVLPVLSGVNLTALGSINLLSDVDTITNAPAINQVLSWDGNNWTPADASGGVTSIANLTDVDITGIVNGQFLKWDGTKFIDHTLVISDLSDGNTLASQTELDTTQSSIGLNANGSRPNYSSTFYILNTDTHHSSLGKLDTQLNSTQTEVNSIETSLGGYINESGIWIAPVGTNYLNTTTSFSNALFTLDSQAKTNADNINLKLDSASYTANDVLTKIKTVDGSGSGLDADLLDGLNSTDFVQVTSLDTISGNIEGAIPTLDENGHIKSNQLPNLAITHVSSGLLADRPLPDVNNVGDVYITTDTFQTFISTGAEWLEILNPSAVSIAELQSELDETQVSVGLNADGSKPVYSSINYILNTDSHNVAIGKLDTQVKNNTDNISSNSSDITNAQNEIDEIESSLGLNIDGTRPNYSSTNYILNTDNHNVAIGKLDTQLHTLQNEIDITQTNLGLNADGTIPLYSSNNYILNTDTHHSAIGKLDAQAKTNADNINLKLDIASYTAEDVFNKVLSLDGSGSGLDADLLDGLDATDFVQVTSLDTIAGNVQGAIPTLDENGHIKSDQLPNLAITHVSSGLLADRPLPDVNNVGDVYITTDTYQTFISTGTEWLEILNPSSVSLAELQSELDTTQSNLGLNADGSRPVYTSTHYFDDIDSHHTALGKLDNSLWNLEDTVNNLASTDLTDSNDLARLSAVSNTFSGDLSIDGYGFVTTPDINSSGNEIATAQFVIEKTQNLLVDDQGRFIESIDYGFVTDNVIGSSIDFQNANGDGETPLNAEDLFLNTVYYSVEDYGCLLG
jgi:hypothetical protein